MFYSFVTTWYGLRSSGHHILLGTLKRFAVSNRPEGAFVNSQGRQPLETDVIADIEPWKGDRSLKARFRVTPSGVI